VPVAQIFFSLPPDATEKKGDQEPENMDLNAVLSLGVRIRMRVTTLSLLARSGQGVQVHVDCRKTPSNSSNLAFASLDRKSMRLTPR
jgi:hypothetical protein